LVVITLDEADRIADCVRSVPFASEVVVVDNGSTDDTVAIARGCGARVIETDDWPGFPAQKNRGLDACVGPWVLHLDADERLSTTAASALAEALEADDNTRGFSFNRCSRWMGRPIRHGRWYPDRQLRVVRKGHGRWGGLDPHDGIMVAGRVRHLSGDIDHFPYRDLQEHLGTIRKYTRVSARSMASVGRRARWWDRSLRPPLHFVDAFLLRRGFLDGGRGLALASLGAWYVWLKYARLAEERR